jgi:hypothetical protein
MLSFLHRPASPRFGRQKMCDYVSWPELEQLRQGAGHESAEWV